MTWKRLALALALPAIGMLELAGVAVATRRAPRPADYDGLAAPVRDLVKPGQPVVVAPRWAEPHARRALGDDVFPIAELARSGLDRYPAVLEISILGETDADLAGWPVDAERTVGSFTLRRRVNPTPRPVVFDFVDHLAPPDVEVRLRGPDAACTFNPRARIAAGGLGGHPTFPAARFECPGSVFFNVSATVIADERFLPRRCVWAHPPATGALVIGWEGVALGSTLEGHSGMYWIVERARQGAPITLEAKVGDDVVGTSVHADGEGWKPFRFELGSHAGTTARVELAVSSPDHRHRHFCFEATSR